MPQEKISFNRFNAGFISELDINGLQAPDGSCKDISNFEINAPNFALKESTGSDVVYALPSYSGSRIVAHKNWSVTNPSARNLTTLITASSNLLLYSEDFDITTAWTLTAGGATLTPNNQTSPQLIRKADRLTNIGASTKLEQLFNGVTGTQYSFSVYFKKTTAHTIRLSIVDNVGSSSTASADATGNWVRLTHTRTCTGATGFLVRIEFPDSAGVDTCDLWGAQLEVAAVASGYGYTFHYNLPYYILQRPYWNGVNWIDNWFDLTEMRSGAISSSANGVFTIAGIDGSSGYYDNWYALDNVLTVPTGYITSYLTGGVFNIVGKKIAVDGHFVIISRFPFFDETPYFQQGLIIEKNITLIDVDNSLKISFGKTHRPLTLKYIDSNIFNVVGGEEILVPGSDIHLGTGWGIHPSIPATFFDKLLTPPSDDKYIMSVSSDYVECKFSATANTPTIARYQYEAAEWLTDPFTIRADLYCGATLIHTGNTVSSGLYTYKMFTEYLSPAEVAAITAIGGTPWSDLRVRFYSSGTYKIIYCDLTIAGYGSGSGSLNSKGFNLTYSSHIGVQIPSKNNPVLTAATLVESEGVGFGASVITLTPGSSGTLVAGDYKIYVVGVIDGNQRIPIFTDAATVGATGSIAVAIPIVANGFDWRLTALEVYIGNGQETPGDTSAYYLYATVLMKDVVNGVLTTSTSDNNWTITVTVTAINSLQSTLLYNLGGCLDIIETRARYNVAAYLFGRMYIAQTQETENIIRYSNIRGLVSEIDKFAYSDAGYGFFDNGTMVVNIGGTIENDLLVIRENKVSLFENTSAKRLRQSFNGIGGSNSRSLVLSDYGNFWYDSNDIYWYQGGYALPTKISKDKLRHYWRSTLASYVATSFAIFNNKVNEYWIVIYNGTNWVILRYSPEHGNWNIRTPGFTPVWASKEVDGTTNVDSAGNIYNFTGTTVTSNPYIVTHKRKMSEDSITPKQVEEAYIDDYSSSNAITMAITIDNETSPRTGNSPVFIASKKSQRRTIRRGSSFNYATIKLSVNAGGLTQISDFGLAVQPRKDRTGGRK
jgi:hypothetical protein